MQILTKFCSFEKLATAEGASTVARMAMVCNDLAIANTSLRHFQGIEDNALQDIQNGAKLYFVRMSIGHLWEGIEVITDIRGNQTLNALVDRCNAHAQSAFEKLCDYLPQGKHRPEYAQNISRVRDRVAFHYDPDEVNRAIEDRATRKTSSAICSMTFGRDMHSSRFGFADALLATTICRSLWGIKEEGEDGRKEMERREKWCFDRSIEFLDFGGEFVRLYMERLLA